MPLCIFDYRKSPGQVPAKSRPTYAKLTNPQKPFKILGKLNFEGTDWDTNDILDYAPMHI